MVSLIIPSWNGKKLLEKNLPRVLKALPKDGELIVVDDGSKDDSLSYLKEIKKREGRLRLVVNNRNLGFVRSCNRGVKRARGDLVALINNDVIPRKGFLAPALRHFDDPTVFAVSFKEVGSKWGSWARVFWRGGFFNYLPGRKTNRPHISGWANGGSAIFRKSMWLKLGGLDRLYEPFYWEDLDLSYRAWKRGWRVVWEPEAKVRHEHASTISRFDPWYISIVRERNQLLFIWKNITDPRLRLSHFFGLIGRVLTGPNYLKVIIQAKKRYWQFGRPKEKNGVRSDREVFALFQNDSFNRHC